MNEIKICQSCGAKMTAQGTEIVEDFLGVDKEVNTIYVCSNCRRRVKCAKQSDNLDNVLIAALATTVIADEVFSDSTDSCLIDSGSDFSGGGGGGGSSGGAGADGSW